MRRLLIFLLVTVFITLTFSACNEEGAKKEQRPAFERRPVSEEEPDFDEEEQSTFVYGEATVVKRQLPDSKYIPGTEYDKIGTLKGGADKEAIAMRDKILSAEDELEISGKKYYFSSKGNDDNDGKTPQTPKKNLDAIGTLLLEPGDAILLERGSVFRISSSIRLRSEGTMFGAYGTGPKPEIWGSVENYARIEKWEPYKAKNVWQMDLSLADAGMVIFNHGEAIGKKKFSSAEIEGNFDYYHDMEEAKLYLYYDKGNPGKVFEDIEIGTNFSAVGLGADNLTVNNICFKYIGAHGIAGNRINNIKITDCEFGWIGGSLSGPKVRYGNAVQFGEGGGTNLIVDDNWVYQIYDAGLTFQDYETEVNDTTWENISFSNNLIEYCTMPLEWWNSKEKLNNIIKGIIFKGNIMRFSGFGWGVQRPDDFNAGISCSGGKDYPNLSDFIVEDNIFDCGKLIISWTFNTIEPGWEVRNNSFYQRPYKENRYFNIGAPGNNDGYAKNAAEFEALIKRLFDSTPKEIKWME